MTGVFIFFFNDTATTEIYTLSLQRRSSDLPDPESGRRAARGRRGERSTKGEGPHPHDALGGRVRAPARAGLRDRKSTRLNSSHSQISYAVFCLKKKKDRWLEENGFPGFS